MKQEQIQALEREPQRPTYEQYKLLQKELLIPTLHQIDSLYFELRNKIDTYFLLDDYTRKRLNNELMELYTDFSIKTEEALKACLVPSTGDSK